MWELNQNIFIRPHEGKSHLKKEIPKKAKAYSKFSEPILMLILQDQDSNDCKVLKNSIETSIINQGMINYKIRIVCRELECWYLGDLHSIEEAYPKSKTSKYSSKSKFRNPDILNGKDEIKKWITPYGSIECASKLGQLINHESNNSESFNQTISYLKSILN